MNKKKLIIKGITGFVILTVILLFLYINPFYKKIDEQYIKDVKKYYSIELPSYGSVTLHNGDRGRLLEVAFSKIYYEKVTNQLVEKMSTQPYSTDLKVWYGLEDREIEGDFYANVSTLGEGSYGYDPNHIFISGVDEGRFKIYIELRGIENE